tara:strand:+ start:121956 stop:126611 length:4656 start_codon:yes stop_codon:yes gene_type:complete
MKPPQGLSKISKIEKMNFFISLFQNSPIPKTISSISEKKYVFVNSAWEKFTGYSKKEAIGKTAFNLNLVTEESGELIRKKILKEKEIISFEYPIRLKNGTKKNVLVSFDIISINDEDFVLNTINNLDELHIYKEQHEKVLIKRTEELLSAKDFIIDSIENMTDGFVSLNNDWIYTYVNQKAAEILGKTPTDLIGKHIWTEFPEGVGQAFYNNYYKAVEIQQTISFEEYFQPWNRWFENRVIPSNEGLSVFFQDITSRVKAQEDIKVAKEFSEELILSLKSGLVVMNIDGEIIDVNPAFCKLTNFKKKELLGKTAPFPFWPPESYEAIQACLQKTLQGEIGDFEFLFMRKGGERFQAALATSSIKNREGEIIAFFVTIDDITERKKAEELLIKSEKSLDNFINNIGDPLFVKDSDSRLLLVNDAFCKMFNLSKTDIIGKTLAEDVTPEEREVFLRIDRQVLSTGVENINEENLTVRGEKTRIISTKKNRFIDDSGKRYLIGIIRDITERKQSEIKLKESEKSLLEAQKIAKLGSYNLDLKTQIAETSMIFNEIVGLDSNSELTFDIWRTITHPEDTLNNQKVFDECLETGGVFDLEYRILTKNKKELKWIHGLGEVVYTNGEATNFFGTIQDITDRKQVQIELNSAKDFSEGLIKSMHEGLVVFSLHTEIISVNPSFCEMSGFTENELIGKKCPYPFSPPEIIEEANSRHEKLTKGEHIDGFESVYMQKNGTRFNVHVQVSSIWDKDKNRIAYFGTVQDITKRKKAEIELNSAKDFSESLINSMRNGLSVIDATGKHIHVNPALCKITGYSKKELIGAYPPFPFWPPEYYDEINDIFKNTLLGIDKSGEVIFKRKNGERFPAQITISRVKNEDDENVAFIGTIEDVSVKVKAREALKAAKEFSDKLIMSMQEGLIIVNLEGEILMVNDSTCKILGYSKEELIGLNLPYPFARIEDFEEIGRKNNRISEGEKLTFQFDFIRKSKEKFLASFSTGNIKNDEGEVIALFGTMKDVSEEHKVKKALNELAIKSTQKKDVILKLASLVGKNFKDSLKSITKEAAETLNVGRVSIWSFNFDKTEIYCENLYAIENDLHTKGFILKSTDNLEYFKALEENKTILVSDAQKNNITKKFTNEYLIPNNIKSLMDVFINSTKGYYGIICFEHVGDTNRNWTADEQEFATSIANIVSIMVESNERKAAETKIVKANEQLIEANNELNTLRNQLEQENVYLRNELDLVFNYEEMIYGSVEFSDVLTEVERVAPTNATVLLLGESGTGKELLARAIHNIGLRSNKPLIKVNCSAIPRELIESELFGHKKGSFTGAFNDKVGKFELADGGTLFLDEIGELPLDMQPKILRFLQEGEIEVVGGTKLKKLDVRIIAATNRNLKEEIEKKQFREDLYFRLHVFPIEIPPLRKRKKDIPLLAEHFVDKFNKAYAKNIKYIPDDSMDQLKSYNWPGNIRELENLIERASILSTSDTLLIPGFESETQKSKLPINSKDLSLNLAQRNHILQVLEQCHWKISGTNGAAVLLDLKPSTLRDKMAKLNIVKPSSR